MLRPIGARKCNFWKLTDKPTHQGNTKPTYQPTGEHKGFGEVTLPIIAKVDGGKIIKHLTHELLVDGSRKRERSRLV